MAKVYGILGDLHANIDALSVVLDDAASQGFDSFENHCISATIPATHNNIITTNSINLRIKILRPIAFLLNSAAKKFLIFLNGDTRSCPKHLKNDVTGDCV